MPTHHCPACDAVTEADDTSCAACGEPLRPVQKPAPSARPKRRSAEEFTAEPVPVARRARPVRKPLELDEDDDSLPTVADQMELKKLAKAAASGLFAVAVLNLVCGTIGVFVLSALQGNQLPADGQALGLVLLLAAVVGISVVFAGLGWWALYQPLPPAIVGLVLYVLIAVADLIATLSQGNNPLFGIVMKVVLTIALIKGVQAATQYNQLKQEVNW